ncbi:MAG TPA: hypothetical protein VFD04_24860 [Actinomycetes bacterium]|jgi:hypothetical protein|nr:hypothetical protein [Actinomycetes bacterium]
MRRIRTGPAAPAAGWPAAGALAVAAALVALACPSGTPVRPAATAAPSRPALGGSLAAWKPALLPAPDLGREVVTADQPTPTPAAADLAAPAPAAGRSDPNRGRPAAPWPARRPGHDAAGGPRAPPPPTHPG